ncbi:MAG: T9SS type A sorting domain-containing protein [Bacteroidales bacterium]|nr:T9SS type A sorting domain-containing protein [Bacteroidales bacterium]MDD4217412.1 T9SS type A sorting domain-containing protein [Bacteroidales bacterium]
MNNNENTTISACTEIVIAGDVEFIADGEHELILSNITEPCMNNSSSNNLTNLSKTSHITPNNPNIEDCFYCFPNPVSNILTIVADVKMAKNIKIDLYNISGQKINEIYNGILSAGEKAIEFDTSYLKPGVYYLRISYSKEYESLKIIKM